MKPYSIDLRKEIVESVSKGVSKSETARRLGVDRSTVKRYLSSSMKRVLFFPRRLLTNLRSQMRSGNSTKMEAANYCTLAALLAGSEPYRRSVLKGQTATESDRGADERGVGGGHR